MLHTPILSICIPTYNRARYLQECLESIFPAANRYREQLEIIIADNASIDDTEHVVAEFRKEYPWVQYHRHPCNIGAERNIQALARMASGQYVWFFGDDDKMTEEALPIVLDQILSGYNLIVTNFASVPRDSPSAVKPVNWFPPNGNRRFDRPDELMSCFGAGLGFLSCIVINRKLFLNHDLEEYEAYADTGFAFLYAVYAGIAQKMPAIFVASPLVLNRWTGMNEEVWEKFFITGSSLALEALSKKGYSTNAIRQAKHRVVMDFVLGNLVGRKAGGQRLKGTLARMWPHYYHLWSFWMLCVPLLCVPRFVVTGALKVHVLARRIVNIVPGYRVIEH